MKKSLVVALFLCSILAACSGAPGDDDVRAAFDSKLKQFQQSMSAVTGKQGSVSDDPGMKAALAKVHIVGCTKADAGGYQCDVSGISGDSVSSIRMVKDGSSWKIVE